MSTIPTSKQHKKYIDLNFESPKTEVPKQKTDDFNLLCYLVFNTIDGKKLLEILDECYLKAPIAQPGQGTDYFFIREGQNTLIRRFHNEVLRYELENKK